eukprot:28262-Pelagococcus_subviridis.AAC.3
MTSSLRSGDDSTWQCEHAWLQYRPMLTWRIVVGLRTSADAPRSTTKASKFGTSRPSSARRLRARSSFVSALCPSAFSRFAASLNSSSVSISLSVSGTSEPNAEEDEEEEEDDDDDGASEGALRDRTSLATRRRWRRDAEETRGVVAAEGAAARDASAACIAAWEV